MGQRPGIGQIIYGNDIQVRIIQNQSTNCPTYPAKTIYADIYFFHMKKIPH
ncbi:MAG: hypothetical protein ACJAUO_002193 [Sediminicola sp.]|jgi:hypothetical protein